MNSLFVILQLLQVTTALTLHARTTKDELQKIDLTSTDPLAVCNDGSPATYYWKKSPTGSNKWLVMLAGGVGCYDEASCAHRADGLDGFPGQPPHHLSSSKNLTSTL